jgi:hypothetical protein
MQDAECTKLSQDHVIESPWRSHIMEKQRVFDIDVEDDDDNRLAR